MVESVWTRYVGIWEAVNSNGNAIADLPHSFFVYAISAFLRRYKGRGGIVLNSKEMYGLNKSISEFYQQQRNERINLWRDVSRLRLQFPENAQQYLSAYRKVSILEDDKGDAR